MTNDSAETLDQTWPELGMVERFVIESKHIYDGSGGPAVEGSVLIEDGLIVAVGQLENVEDAERIDARGFAVTPGLIDMHTHSDVSALSDPDCLSAIWQGITTQIVGHCGFSAAPTDQESRRNLTQEEPVFGFPLGAYEGTEWGWDSMAEYMSVLSTVRPRTNIGTLVGHNTLRRMVIGSSDRPATARDLAEMCGLAEVSLDAGALGLSTGLSYSPGKYARSREINALARTAGRAGVRYHTHMRYGGVPIRDCLAEAIETGRMADCSVNVSHLYPVADDDRDEASVLLEMVDEANQNGQDVTFDLTLFRRGGGAWAQALPAWALDGGASAVKARIDDSALRSKMIAHLERLSPERDWHDYLIVKVSDHAATGLVGQSIGDVADDSGRPPEEAALDLLKIDPQFWVAPTIKRQDDLDALIQHQLCVPVTDGMSAHPVKHAHLGLMPKTFGTFPLLFGDYVRDRGVLDLSLAISKVTSVPAGRLGLSDRGRLAPGYRADILVFDPLTITNVATDDNPGVRPTGIRDVMVNGVWAVKDSELTPRSSGEVLM